MTRRDWTSNVQQVLATGQRTVSQVHEDPTGSTQFVTMVKPEALDGPSAAVALSHVEATLLGGGASIGRVALWAAPVFQARGMLLRHYPRLHRVSADGIKALSTSARLVLEDFLSEGPKSHERVVGAYEAMQYEHTLTPAELERRCRTAGIHKLGSGSYVSRVVLGGEGFVVLNGFLPALVMSYTDPGRLVAVMECRSDREIEDLRTNLLGDLDPMQAAPMTLRGALGDWYRSHHRGPVPLSPGRNGVHLSAGHLEAMFQQWAHFLAADGLGLEQTRLGKALVPRGVDIDFVALLASDNEVLDATDARESPHGITEGLPWDRVIEHVVEWAQEGSVGQ